METVSSFVNELLTYGVISVSAALPVQSCHTNNITMQYNGPTYAILDESNTWRKKAVVTENKKSILFGGYSNMEVPEQTKNIAAN